MDTLLQGLEGVICYVDDLLITVKSAEEHFENLRKVLARLQENDVKLKNSKCSVGKKVVHYLGHKISTDDKVKAITEAPTPKNLIELRSFLGLLNYYGRFISNLSTLIHPLNELLKRERAWKWTEECYDDFK